MPETRPQIRPATAADAPAISALWNPIIRDTVVTFNPVERDPAEIAEMIATRQAGPGAFFRGRARGRAAGLCQLRHSFAVVWAMRAAWSIRSTLPRLRAGRAWDQS